MKRREVVKAVIVGLILLLLSSCAIPEERVPEEYAKSLLGERFTYEKQVAPNKYLECYIATDIITGKQYMILQFREALQVVEIGREDVIWTR